jgi:hypothetical protein
MNTTTFNKYDYLLTHFVSSEPISLNIMQAYEQNAYIYATDAHLMIRIPKSMCAKNYNQVDEKSPDFEKFMQIEMNCVGELNIHDVLPCIDNIKVALKGHVTTCDECEGEGESYCKCCHNTNDCEECNGTGSIEGPAKIMIRDVAFVRDGSPISAVKIGLKRYNPVYLELIMFAMLVSGAESCMYYESDARGIFKFGDIEILLMALSL